VWHIDDGRAVPHDASVMRDDMLVLREEDWVGFVLDPAEPDEIVRMRIGDAPMEDIAQTLEQAEGMLNDGRRVWSDFCYFDSARGSTTLVVESRPERDESAPWELLCSARLYVVPTKLGEQRYLAMGAELDSVSHSLLADLYGKSRRTVDMTRARSSRHSRPRDVELQAIERALLDVEVLMDSISRRPASCVASDFRPYLYWGQRRLHPAAITRLTRRGVDPRHAPRPVSVLGRTKQESYDIPEHRMVRAFLALLAERSALCATVARSHAEAIMADRSLRDVRLRKGLTLYEAVDAPQVERLRRAGRVARRCQVTASAMQQMPIIRAAPAEFTNSSGGSFQRSDEYRALFAVMRRFLENHADWYRAGDYALTVKLTWRMYEQWVFLRIVNAFRAAGVDLREWTDALRQNVHSRFVIDFDRGLTFEGVAGHNLRIRFRYEPWILGRSAAEKRGESLYRGRSGRTAWSPDVVVECLRSDGGEWVTVYAVVVDCKYSSRLDRQWRGGEKYLEIRSTATGKQVARQIWLAGPGNGSPIHCEDSSIEFTRTGPTCDVDDTVHFRLNVAPVPSLGAEEQRPGDGAFDEFALGTLAFLRGAFGGPAQSTST